MQEFIDELEQRKAKARQMGGEQKVALQHQLGRLTARERIDKLVDPGSFMELGLLSHSDAPGMEDKSPADGLIAGLAKIDARPVAVSATDKTVFAGTEGTVYIGKDKLLSELAVRKGYPLIHLGEGGRVRMPDGMGSDGISTEMMPLYLLRHGRQTLFIATIMGDSFRGPTGLFGWQFCREGLANWPTSFHTFIKPLLRACTISERPDLQGILHSLAN